MRTHKPFKSNKNTLNNTGFYRVSIHKDPKIKKGYRFFYSINNEVLKVNIAKANLLDLKEAVINNNLQWFIIDKNKAMQTCINENINPLNLNSNVNPKYINYKFDFKDMREYKKRIEKNP